MAGEKWSAGTYPPRSPGRKYDQIVPELGLRPIFEKRQEEIYRVLGSRRIDLQADIA